MKVLVISQVYWPDTASVAQHLTDISEELAKNETNKVAVVTSRNDYENPAVKYASRERRNNVDIARLNNSAFGKQSKIGRLVDFATFNSLLAIELLSIKKGEFDLILGSTVPPLVSFIGAVIARFKKMKFCYWVMDLQPELSISSGYLDARSLLTKFLLSIGDYIMRNSHLIIVLDSFMKEHVQRRRNNRNTAIQVIPVWPVVQSEYSGERLSNPYRVRHGFGDRLVIMYSGNHSVVHPLDTLLGAARELSNDKRFLFIFIGGGIRKKDVTDFKDQFGLENIIQLPYIERSEIHYSLSSADIQVVVMGDKVVGFTHPNKIYGALYVGKPILYIGPRRSHVMEILNALDGNISVSHGQTQLLVSQLIKFSQFSLEEIMRTCERNRAFAIDHFSPSELKRRMIAEIDGIFR